jgi:hypothetical protein
MPVPYVPLTYRIMHFPPHADLPRRLLALSMCFGQSRIYSVFSLLTSEVETALPTGARNFSHALLRAGYADAARIGQQLADFGDVVQVSIAVEFRMR